MAIIIARTVEAIMGVKMRCKDCPYLVKTDSVEIVGYYDLYCDKYGISHSPICEANLDYLNCVENQRNFEEVVRGDKE